MVNHVDRTDVPWKQVIVVYPLELGIAEAAVVDANASARYGQSPRIKEEHDEHR